MSRFHFTHCHYTVEEPISTIFYANRFLTVKPLHKDTYSTNINAQQSVDLYIEMRCFKEGDPHDQVYAKAQNHNNNNNNFI